MKRQAFSGKSVFVVVLLVALAAPPASATVLLFENVKLPIAKELDGLQSVTGYGDLVKDVDYLVWGDKQEASDKTGVTVGSSTYHFKGCPVAPTGTIIHTIYKAYIFS